MHDRITIPKLVVGELPEVKGQGRDLRIDACRGIALWCIFLDHVPNNIGSWLTLRNYGFSDAAEVFMFVSGVTCALAYGRAWRCEGWTGVISRTLRRGWDIYVAFLLLTLACAILVHFAGRIADESNMRILLDHPGATLARAAVLQYRPVNTDVLSVFVLLHLLFAPLLWMLLRAPNATLGVSVALYVLVHVFGWFVPAWPNGHWAFNPLAWQLLFVLGAWWMIEDKRSRPWVTSRTTLMLAVLYLLFSLVIALSWRIKPLEALIPQALATLLYPLDKSRSRSIATAAFFGHSGFGDMARASQLARADDAGNARRDLLWPELAANLLPWCSADVRQPRGAARHFRRACDADSIESRWHRGDDRVRNTAELDQHQTRAAIVISMRSARMSMKDEEGRYC
ncbi:OpgC domain-containing protein [Bradyrhizobium sp. RDT10]